MKSLHSRKKLVRSCRRGDSHFYIRHGIRVQNTRRRSSYHCALSRFRRALDAEFLSSLSSFPPGPPPGTFPETPYIRHSISPLPPVCRRRGTRGPSSSCLSSSTCGGVRRDRRRCKKRRVRAPPSAGTYRVRVERSSKTTDSSSRFRKTISTLVITDRTRLIIITKKLFAA